MSDGPAPFFAPFPRRGHLLAGAGVLTLLVIYGSFVPLEFRSLSFDAAVEQFKSVPYLDLSADRRADLVANLVLFVPLGFLWLGVIDVDRRSRAAGWLALPIVVAVLIAVAVAMEFAQQWTARRTVSQNDMIAESVGALLGAVLWMMVGRRLIGFVRGLTATNERGVEVSPTRRLLQLYALGFLLYAFQPFDFTFSPEEIGRQFRDRIVLKSGGSVEGRIVANDRMAVRIATNDDRGVRTIAQSNILQLQPRKVVLRPFSHTYRNPFDAAWQIGSDVVLFIPIGMLLGYRRNVKRPFMKAVLLGCAAAAVIEGAQLFVYSRYLDSTDVFTSGLGALIGAALAGRFAIGQAHSETADPASSATRRVAAIGMCLLYTLPLAVIVWHPYKLVSSVDIFVQQFKQIVGIPFKAYYYAGEFKAVSTLMRNLMLFWPVGALLRWGFSPVRRGSYANGICVMAFAVGMGLVLEAGKAAMVNKHADVTDLLIYAGGALMGWWLWGVLTAPRPVAQAASKSG